MTDRSQLETARLAFRARLLANEADATGAVAEQFLETRQRILEELGLLEDEIEEAGEAETVTERIAEASRLFREYRYKRLLAQIDEEMARLGRAVAPVITDAQAVVVGNALDETRRIALTSAAETSQALALRVAGQWSMLPVDALNELIGAMQDGSPLAEWIEGFGPDIGAKITDTLRDGLALGFHPRKISDQLLGVIDGGGARLMVGTRSIILDSYRSAALQQMAENADILDGWIWQSAHDTRTCAACLALDNGEVHPVTETFMRSHVGCRCNPRPMVTGTEPPTRETGEQYLNSLLPQDQNRILGIAGGDAFRRGDVRLNDFLHLDRNSRWGDRYRQGSLRDALKRSDARGAIKAQPVTPSKDIAQVKPEQVAAGLRRPTKPPKGAPKFAKGIEPPPLQVGDRQMDHAHGLAELDALKGDKTGFAATRKTFNKRFYNNLSDEEQEALYQYTKFNSIEVNRMARGIKDPSEYPARNLNYYTEQTGILDRIFSRSDMRLPESMPVYRGVDSTRVFGQMSKARPGDVVTDWGFGSFTGNRRVASDFGASNSGGVLFELIAPKGTRSAYVESITNARGEQELIMPRGTTFVIHETKLVTKNGYTSLVVRGEIIPDG